MRTEEKVQTRETPEEEASFWLEGLRSSIIMIESNPNKIGKKYEVSMRIANDVSGDSLNSLFPANWHCDSVLNEHRPVDYLLIESCWKTFWLQSFGAIQEFGSKLPPQIQRSYEEIFQKHQDFYDRVVSGGEKDVREIRRVGKEIVSELSLVCGECMHCPDFQTPEVEVSEWLSNLGRKIKEIESCPDRKIESVRSTVQEQIANYISEDGANLLRIANEYCDECIKDSGSITYEDLQKLWKTAWLRSTSAIKEFGNKLPPQIRQKYEDLFQRHQDFVDRVVSGEEKEVREIWGRGKEIFSDLDGVCHILFR